MRAIQDLSFTAPQLAAPGTAVSGPSGTDGYDACTWLCITGTLQGLTGGTLDVTIQDSPDGVTWQDYARFAQIAAGAAKATFAFSPGPSNVAVAIGNPTTDPAAPTPAIAAGTARGGHPFRFLRAVAVAGAGTSAGAAQTIRIVAR